MERFTAKNKDGYYVSDKRALRSPGSDNRFAAYVGNVGGVSVYGSGYGGVRPAPWLNLKP